MESIEIGNGGGEVFEREFWGSEGEALVGGGASEMEEPMFPGEEPEAKVSVHCQSFQAL